MQASRPHAVTALFLVLLFATTGGADVGPTFLGPTPYLSAADSPFNLAGPNFCLEDFEDGGPVTPPKPGSREALLGAGRRYAATPERVLQACVCPAPSCGVCER